MANRKISDLTSLTAPATGDLLPIVDISEAAAADKNKKITYAELLASAPAGSAAAPSFSFDGDPNTGIFNPAADSLAFAEGGVEAMRIDSSGRVGIGGSPGAQLDILGTTPSLHVGDNTGGTPDYRGYSLDLSRVQQTGGINLTASSPSIFLDLYAGGSAANLGAWDGQIRFFTGGTNAYGTERARIDSSGRLLVGTSTARVFNAGIGSATPRVQIEGTGDESILSITRNSADIGTPRLVLGKSRGASIGGTTAVQDGDFLGQISFEGTNGTSFNQAARIDCFVDGAVSGGGAGDMPGRLVFSTTADGASTPTERMRIKSNGTINFSNVATYADNTAALAGGLVAGDVYRKSDGTLMITY